MIAVVIWFCVFLAAILGVGIFAGRYTTDDEDDYTTGRRSLNKYLIGLSAGATGNSGFIMLGAVGLGYLFGITFVFLPLAWLLGDLFFWKFFPERLNRQARERAARTIPEFLEHGLDGWGRSVRLIAGGLLVLIIGAYGASQFTAASKTLNVFFDFGQREGVIACGVLVVLYCVWGGFRASVWTDVVQAVFMLGVTTFVVPAILVDIGGIGAFIEEAKNINPGFLVPFSGWPILIVIAFFCTWALAAVGFGVSQPQVVVRYFAGKSPEETRAAKWVYLAFLQYTWVGMTIFGALSRVMLNGLKDHERALPEYVIGNFPPVVTAFVLAGIFSAIASTLDSILLSISSVISIDVVPSLFRKRQWYRSLLFHRIVVVLFGAATIVVCLVSESDVFGLSAYAVSLITGTVAPAMILRVFGVTRGSAIVGAMVFGGLTFVAWNWLGMNGWTGAYFPRFECVPAFLVGTIAGFLIGRRPTDGQVANGDGQPAHPR